MKEIKYTILYCVCEHFVLPFYYGSGSGFWFIYGSGSYFLARYGSGSASQKVTVPVPQRWLEQGICHVSASVIW